MSDLHFNQISFDLPVLHRFLQETFSDWVKPEDVIGILVGRWLGDKAPRSLRIEENKAADTIAVYFWSQNAIADLPAELLRLKPDVVTRQLPSDRLAAAILRFNLRCSPVIRRRGRETDAWEPKTGHDHAEAYRRWTASRLKGADLAQFGLANVYGKTIALPGQDCFKKLTAEIDGTLCVRNVDDFAKTLLNGIGRNGRLGLGTLIIGQAPDQEPRNPMPH